MRTSAKILIIDDDVVGVTQLKNALSNSGFACDITECTEAEQVVAHLLHESFDCVFLEYVLPDHNGLRLLKKIREQGCKIPIVIITAHGNETIAVELMKAGASDYLTKNQVTDAVISQIFRNIMRTNLIEKEKEEAERALHVSESRLATAQRIANIGNWEFDWNKKSLYWSDQVYSIFEVNKKDLRPQLKDFINLIDPENHKCIKEALRIALKDKAFDLDVKIKTPSGIKYVNFQGYATLREGSNSFDTIFGTIQDITARKLTEQEVLNARQAAENSLKVREVFLANMSHEIRTPMNAIIGFTQLVYETKLTKEQQSYIDAIHFSGENLLVIINDILDLAKIQSGKMVLEKNEFNLSDLIRGIITALKRKANEKGLQLICDIDKSVPSFIKGDPIRINQILTNLISNAIKFTHNGGVQVSIKLEGDENSASILFKVSDSGIGIPAEKHTSIFESFEQGSNDITRNFGGTGLGLAIVKNITDMLHGSIAVESVPGRGSIFTLVLPFEKADLEMAQIRNQKVAHNENLYQLRNVSVLIVDDNHLNQLLVKRVLDKAGCRTDVVSDGSQAIERVRNSRYDVVLMDIQMPEMDGYTATKFIRKNLTSPCSEVPIIAMTAHAFNSEVEKCLSVGMNDYLSKPFKQEVLYAKILKQVTKNDSTGIIPLNSNGNRGLLIDHSADKQDLRDDAENGLGATLSYIRHMMPPDFGRRLNIAALPVVNPTVFNTDEQKPFHDATLDGSEYGKLLPELFHLISVYNKNDKSRLTLLLNAMVALIGEIAEELKNNVRKTAS